MRLRRRVGPAVLGPALLLAGALAVALQGTLVPAIRVGSVVPDLPFALSSLVALRVAGPLRRWVPLFVGIVLDLAGGGPVGAWAVLLVVSGWALRRASLWIDIDGRLTMSLLVGIASLVANLAYAVFVAAPDDVLPGVPAVWRSTAVGAYTALVAAAIDPILAAIATAALAPHGASASAIVRPRRRLPAVTHG